MRKAIHADGFWRRSGVLGAGLALALSGSAGALEGASPAPPEPPRQATVEPAPRRLSVKDSPGYVPLVDPESTAVALGRRANTPPVRHRFRGGARSLDELGRLVCRAIHRGDRDALMALCVTDEEFRDVLWPEFPQSRPVTGLQWEDGWRVLSVRLLSGCNHAIVEHGGRYHEFVRFESDSTGRYRNFDLHGGLAMVVKGPDGALQRWTWLRSVAERKGVFKIYSTDD